MYVNSGRERFDIREYKKNLRTEYRRMRLDMPPDEKERLDTRIRERLVSSKAYKNCDILLTYVSTPIEVDTRGIISAAFSDGKTVAVPKCTDSSGNMTFYVIENFEQLEPGAFSVLEPSAEKCRPAERFENAVCIVPALAYDMDGYRIGYGGGYYDRFLSAHRELYNIGIEYCRCTAASFIKGRYDVAADMLVTEKYIKKIKRQEADYG